MISVQGAWWPYKYKNKSYQYYLTKELLIFWNWFLELKMDNRHLYYLFFYCFNLFTITLLASSWQFLKSTFWRIFQHFSKTTSLTKISSMIWKPDRIPLSVLGVTCMYCKNWMSNGHFCGGKRYFFYTL